MHLYYKFNIMIIYNDVTLTRANELITVHTFPFINIF